MYAKVYQYKFPSVSEAKIAASFCADTLGKKIVDFNFQGLNVMIGKDGDLSIIIKFRGQLYNKTVNICFRKFYEIKSGQQRT